MNLASRRHLPLFSLLGLFVLGSSALAAGDLNYQEKGDLQWRQLQILPDDHGAVYDEFTAGNPLDKNTHNLVEMEGPALQIRSLTLRQFIDTSGDFCGAYSYPLTVLDRETRQEIVRLARRLRDFRNPITGQRIQYKEPPDIGATRLSAPANRRWRAAGPDCLRARRQYRFDEIWRFHLDE